MRSRPLHNRLSFTRYGRMIYRLIWAMGRSLTRQCSARLALRIPELNDRRCGPSNPYSFSHIGTYCLASFHHDCKQPWMWPSRSALHRGHGLNESPREACAIKVPAREEGIELHHLHADAHHATMQHVVLRVRQ